MGGDVVSGPASAPDPVRWSAVLAAWANLLDVGPTLTAAERHRAIRAARRAWSGIRQPPDDGGPLEVLSHWVARDPGGLSETLVADLETAGLDRWRYLEVVGVVSRLANVDFYVNGLGGEVFPLPDDAASAPPTGEVAASARITDGWVPATSPLFAPAALNALPTEAAVFLALHEPMYVPFAQFADGGFVDQLTRVQIEYVAARTSYLNECFY